MNNTLEEQIKTVEEISLNAWHPLEQILYDGWILRFAEGYIKRANLVNPVYLSTQNIA
jgi:N-acetylglutamate synthase